MSEIAVVVALDGSADSAAALPVARSFAELEQGVVHIVNVADQTVPSLELMERLGLRVEELEGTVLDPQSGTPAEGILRAAIDCEASFVVLSTHTAEQRSEGVLGSTALEVIRRCPCPVVLVPPERALPDWALRSVLVGHDGRPTTSAAIRPAAELAARAEADLSILYAAEAGTEPAADPGSLPTPRYMDQPQHEWPAWTHEFVQRFFSDILLEVPRVHVALGRGVPGIEIVRHAREQKADLVVLAWGGDWSEAHAPTVKAVLRDAPGPVMIVRTAEAELAEPRDQRGRRPRTGAHPG